MITGNKDTDLIVLIKLNEKEFFIFCGKPEFQNKYINKLSKNQTLWKERLFKYYTEIYPEDAQSWKNLYLNLIYQLDKFKYRKITGYYDYIINWPSSNGYLDMVKYLIKINLHKDKKYFNSDITTSIISASQNGHLNIVKYLTILAIENKINIGPIYNWGLRLSRENNHLDIVNYLLSLPKELL